MVTKKRDIFRLFEYNLHEFEKIRKFDLDQPFYSELSTSHLANKEFGRTNAGFYYIRRYSDDKGNPKLELYINNKLCKLDVLESFSATT